MNTRIYKIMSVLATVAIVASSFVFTLPVAASTPGDGQFTKQDTPTPGTTGHNALLTGSQVTDIAVGADGKTVYVIDAVADFIFKSTDGGMSFDSVRNNFDTVGGAGGTLPCKKISIAPDDVNTVAVVDAHNLVIISKDGGTTWSALPAVPGVIIDPALGPTITDISVAPARSGTLLGREYVVSIADSNTSVGGRAIQAVLTANTVAVNGTYTASYINQSGVANTSAAFSINGTAGSIVAIGIGGDTGVLDVTGINVVVAGNATNTFTITSSSGAPAITFGTVTNGATGTFTNGAAAGVSGGDVQIIGGNAQWASVGGGIAGTADFMTVAVTPNFLGDRCVVAIGTGPVFASTALYIINTSTGSLVLANPGYTKLVAGTPTTGTTDFGSAAGTAITSASISLPTNFDPTTSSGRRAYIGIASGSGAGDNDVYRIDDTSTKALGATSLPVYSVSYAGTVDAGTLFMGPKNNADVKYSKNMTSSSPDWTTTLKDPFVTDATLTPSVLVVAASDFATSNDVFAGTLGAGSAFNVSTDAGVSFSGKSLIDAQIGNAGTGNTFNIKSNLSIASDGTYALATTEDTFGGVKYLTLWKSAVPTALNSWWRLFAKKTPSSGVLWAGVASGSSSLKTSGTAIYLFEKGVTNGAIWVSQDGGVSFSTRNGPSGVAYNAGAVRDTQTAYYGDYTGNIYKSTNAGFTWSTAVSTGMGSKIAQVLLPKANQVIVSGSSVYMSNDDAATFAAMNTGLPTVPAGGWLMAADTAYATNNVIYAADCRAPADGVSQLVYRVKTDNLGNNWENMAVSFTAPPNVVPPNPPVNLVTLTTRSGVLYVFAADNNYGFFRTINPTDVIGNTQQNWKRMNTGISTLAAFDSLTTSVGITVWLRSGGGTGGGYGIYAFNDFLASTKPTLTGPDDNYALAINPNNGNGNPVDLKWKTMGTGTGQVTNVDIEIADKANGLTGLATISGAIISANNPFYTIGQHTGDPVLLANHNYLWRMRASQQASQAMLDSPWSDARTIAVQAGGIVNQNQAGIILTGPQGGATNVDPTLVGFSWAPIQGATEYQIIIATDAALTKTVANTPAKVTTTSFQAAGLSYSTTYFWAVQATKPTTSQQSIGTFTTMAKPAPAATGGGAAAPPITVIVPPAAPAETPAYIWAVIAIGAILVIAVIILIVRTRRVP